MKNDFIPVSNPKLKFLSRKKEILKITDTVIENGMYILGNEVTAFEKEFAQYIGVNYCAAVGNGTDAIAIALKALGVNVGDEVITVSHSAVATVAAIEMIGAVPVFADIEEDSRCINPSKIRDLISSKTKVIIPVHIYGQPARIKQIISISKEYGLKVLEDCAQAHGAKVDNQLVGSFGDAAAFSFYPTKNLGAIGDGGAIVTNDGSTFNQVLAIRQYGWRQRYISDFSGVNSRLDELQAAFLRIKLKDLDDENVKRVTIANRYNSALSSLGFTFPKVISDSYHVYHLYVIESNNRDDLADFLKSKGIGTALHYPLPIHLQPAYKGRIKGSDKLFETERLYKSILSLPMYPELTADQVSHVIDSLRKWKELRG
ncbi:MAG: DegT/DnrJ/EryC1/StrS family aminotransferase [Ignavibacteriaceae bacterium]|nr:DegT/DnrJ/EryC1/StrS family aminotransferase [Ignavibacteriaceae bacterium]